MPPTSADRFGEMALKSVRKYLEDELEDYNGVYLGSPDFDHEFTYSSGVKVPRERPYIVVVPGSEDLIPYEIGDSQINKIILFQVWVVCESYIKQLSRPSQVQQVLYTADHDSTPGRIILYDFGVDPEVDSGYVEVTVGPMAHSPTGIYTGDKKEVKDQLKFTTVIFCEIDREKDKEAELIS